MKKYIAHSSIDERGKTKGGKAGDQTGKEVCIRTFYNMKADYVIRIKNKELREEFGNNMIEICKNNKVGYDQGGRMSLLKEAIKVNFDFSKINTPCEGDCSSTIVAALLGAIYKLYGKSVYEQAYKILVVDGNAAVTGNLRSRMSKLAEKGIIQIAIYSSVTYTRTSLRAVFGDIYLREFGHVICFVADALKRIASYPAYNIGKNYKLQSNMNVRRGAGLNCEIKPKEEWTASGRNHAAGNALAAGTTVTCLEVKSDGVRTWIRIPSGWVCGFNTTTRKIYIK